MKIEKFRIKNYKSIIDSGDCYLASDITILAGKNESGKSAILEALRDFDFSVKIFDDSVLSNSHDEPPMPEITFTVQFNDKDREEVLQSLEIEAFPDSIYELLCAPISIKKSISNVSKDLSAFYSCTELYKSCRHENFTENRNIWSLAISELSEKLPSLNLNLEEPTKNDSEAYELSFAQLEKVIIDYKSGLAETLNETLNVEIDESLERVATLQSELNFESLYKSIFEELKGFLPTFIYFDSFDSDLVYEIPMVDVEKFPAVKDFCKVAEISIEELKNKPDTQKKNTYLRRKSVSISGDFKDYWKQDKITLTAGVNGENLTIAIQEDGKNEDFRFNQRSQGFQWFLAFYLRLKTEGASKKRKVLLIDEPGLFLHAKAQKDVLSVLEKLSEEGMGILFSTHSPYLIDPDKLNRIRLVSKDKKHGSVISNKIHKNAEIDSLTPIVTAIGLGITNNLSLGAANNALVEGITDYYLLGAFKFLLEGELKEFSIIPSASATKINFLASLMIGWGLNFVAVLDTDRSGNNAVKELKKLDLTDERIIRYSEEADFEVEDLFYQDDLRKHFLSETYEDDIGQNSKFIKDQNLDKVLLSKTFFEKVTSGKIKKKDLHNETVTGFTRVLIEISSGLYPVAPTKTEKS